MIFFIHIKKILVKYPSIFLLTFFFLLRIILYCINLEDSYITTHDNLDSVFTWYKVVSDNKIGFSIIENPTVEPIMSGVLRRNHLTPVFNIASIILTLMPNFYGYLINLILAYLIGLSGMYLLLNRCIFKQQLFTFNHFDKVAILISSTFIFFDYYVIYGGGYILGLPLLLYSLIQLYNNSNKSYKYLIIIFCCGLYTSLFLVGIFVIVLSIIFIAIDFLIHKKINKLFIIGIINFFIKL